MVSVNVTGAPAIWTQMVRGSEPSFSVVKPWVLVTVPGTVTGILTEQVLPFVVSVTAVMVFAVGSVVYDSCGEQPSRAMRLIKSRAVSSCFRETMGHDTSLTIS